MEAWRRHLSRPLQSSRLWHISASCDLDLWPPDPKVGHFMSLPLDHLSQFALRLVQSFSKYHVKKFGNGWAATQTDSAAMMDSSTMEALCSQPGCLSVRSTITPTGYFENLPVWRGRERKILGEFTSTDIQTWLYFNIFAKVCRCV